MRNGTFLLLGVALLVSCVFSFVSVRTKSAIGRDVTRISLLSDDDMGQIRGGNTGNSGTCMPGYKSYVFCNFCTPMEIGVCDGIFGYCNLSETQIGCYCGIKNYVLVPGCPL